MGITLSVENGLDQSVNVRLCMRTSRRHAIKSVRLDSGERATFTDRGISGSCIYDWWVQPECPKSGVQLGWWKFPCRAPAVWGEHAYRIAHLEGVGKMEFIVIDSPASRVHHETSSVWDNVANARIVSVASGDHVKQSAVTLEGWIFPRCGSLADAFEAYDALPGDGWSKDAFSSFKEFQDDERGILGPEEVARDSGLSVLELFTALFGPSNADFLTSYHQRRGDTNVQLSFNVGSCPEIPVTRGCDVSAAGNVACDCGDGAAAVAAVAAAGLDDGGAGAGCGGSYDAVTPKALTGLPSRPKWCGTGLITCKANAACRSVPYQERFRVLACRENGKDVVAFHSSGTSSGVPGAHAFRVETLYTFTQSMGEREVMLRTWVRVKFVERTPFRSLIERAAWSDFRRSFPLFVAEVRRFSAIVSRDQGREDGGSSSMPTEDSEPQPSLGKLAQTLPAWFLRPVLAPAHFVLPLVLLGAARLVAAALPSWPSIWKHLRNGSRVEV